MTLTRMTKILLALSLTFCFAGAGVAIVNAERTVAQYKTRQCKDHSYDRPERNEEETSSGDCHGTVPTPEPISILLFSAGLAGVGFAARKRLRRNLD